MMHVSGDSNQNIMSFLPLMLLRIPKSLPDIEMNNVFNLHLYRTSQHMYVHQLLVRTVLASHLRRVRSATTMIFASHYRTQSFLDNNE
eukprot:4994794-Amphidinium_carterae.1